MEQEAEKQQFVNPKELLEHFWNVFVIDALLGNFDRHNGNWGFLFDELTQISEIAPVFDCGSCLLPQADDKIMKAVLENENGNVSIVWTVTSITMALYLQWKTKIVIKQF